MKHKNYILIIFAILMSLVSVSTQTMQQPGMQELLHKLSLAKSESDYNQLSASFSLMAKTEKNNWLPYYYAGLCKSLAALTIKTKNADMLCNEADYFIKKADSIMANNSEIEVLKSLNFSARLNVNPTVRALKYNKQINKANELAIKLDAQNPRAYLQKAQAVFYTPEKFGGGASKALPLYELALEHFLQVKSKTAFVPNWGKEIAEKMIKECKAQIQKKNKTLR